MNEGETFRRTFKGVEELALEAMDALEENSLPLSRIPKDQFSRLARVTTVGELNSVLLDIYATHDPGTYAPRGAGKNRDTLSPQPKHQKKPQRGQVLVLTPTP